MKQEQKLFELIDGLSDGEMIFVSLAFIAFAIILSALVMTINKGFELHKMYLNEKEAVEQLKKMNNEKIS